MVGCNDITKCSGEGCDKKDVCFRYLVEAGEYQSYFVQPPVEPETGWCTYFWDMTKTNGFE